MLRRNEKAIAVWLLLMPLCGSLAIAPAYGSDEQSAANPPASVAAQGDASKGIPPCSSCHGSHGQGNSAVGFPRLAGLPAPYLERQLNALASGDRNNAMMHPVAKTLSAEQLKTLADYYAGLPAPQASGAAPLANAASVEELAKHGRPEQGLPGCVLCHGSGGVGIGEDFPPLAGQSAIYMANQLRAWKQHTRPPGPMGLMSSIAGKLSESDITTLSAYFAAQPSTEEAKP